jgi:hypothetical protein
MYGKYEAAAIRQEFWTNMGRYMSPILSSDGGKVNWINYKTGEKNIAFRMQADNHSAQIFIELSHKDTGIRELYFEQFLQFRKLMEEELGEKWTWIKEATDETGRKTSRITRKISPVNIYNKDDWASLITFFKPRLIALDAFWNQVKYGFESLH